MVAWILLLALVVFLIYMWQSSGFKEDKPGCNTCPNKKNPSLV